ncbi:MAG: hypothetical protein PHD82_14610, partial [Candidatus Riflebacteria bacterium]|nr:hypothetical protein [Candidatus Riflebacteria bacterium]
NERPQRLVIDSFPAGILGELQGLKELEGLHCIYLARILKIDRYLQRLDAGAKLPPISEVIRLEKLSDVHEDFLEKIGAPISYLQLIDPPCPPDPAISAVLPREFDLIIHSGNDDESLQLYRLAEETAALEKRSPDFVVITAGNRPGFLPAGVLHLHCYPATRVIDLAGCVFSAAGFNIMRQMALKNTRHEAMPMPRALDDQFFRAAWHRDHKQQKFAQRA